MLKKLIFLFVIFLLLQQLNSPVFCYEFSENSLIDLIQINSFDKMSLGKENWKLFSKENAKQFSNIWTNNFTVLNTVNFDDMPYDGYNAYPISPNRYPKVSFYAPYSNSTTFTRGGNNLSASFPNHVLVGYANNTGAIIYQSPMIVSFSEPMKDVSFHIRTGGCDVINVDIFDRNQYLQTVSISSLLNSYWKYIELNSYSQYITDLRFNYPCSFDNNGPYIGLDNVTFQENPSYSPIGYFDNVSTTAPIGAYGWSVDPDNPSASNSVSCWTDVGTSNERFITSVPANNPSPDVPYPGNHRFALPIPQDLLDGTEHTMNCYGDDLNGDPRTLLPGSPKLFRYTPNVSSVLIEPITNEYINSRLTSSAIDTPNGGPSPGKRIFSGKTTPEDNVDRKTVRVKAVVGQPGVTVYFRNYDVDDPSNDSVIDPNLAAGNDNREGREVDGPYNPIAAGTLSAISATTNANGEAIVYFTVTKQPGDNFVIAASTNNTYLSGVGVNGTGLKDSSNNPLPTDQAKRTDLLTVWRKVHIEKDSMGGSTGNFVKGFVRGKATKVESNPEWISIYGVSGPPITNYLEKESYKETLAGDGSLLSYGGRMVVAGNQILHVVDNRTDVLDLQTYELKVKSLNGAVYLRPNQPFKLYDDDDFNSLDGLNKDGDTGENIDELSDTLSHLQESEDYDKNPYAAAYIMPEFQWAISRQLNNTNAKFSVYKPCGDDYPYCSGYKDFIDSYRGSKSMESDDFWVGYIMIAYQADEKSDVDSTGFIGGYAPLRGVGVNPPQDVATTPFGITSGGIGEIIFIETMRDYDLKPPPLLPGEVDFNLARTRVVPHELGHQFGLAHGISLPGGGGVMGYTTTPLYFVPSHINYMRWRVHSPGE